MIVGFDPVARELLIGLEDGGVLFTAGADSLVAKHYQDEGILYLELRGAHAHLTFLGLDGHVLPLALEPEGSGRWRVRPVA